MERDELGAWLRLILTPGIGNDSARRLLAALGLPALIFEQDPAALQQLLRPSQAQALQETPEDLPALLDSTWAWLQEAPQTRALVALGDARYPASLLNIEDPPLLLYLMGRLDLPLDTSRSLAMVGSRNPTPQGALNARQFAQALGQAGLTIVSGLALGIDGAAHEGALAGHAQAPDRLATVAVVGTGLDRVYPKGHRDLAHRICEHGLLISEYPLGTPPLAANFPRRNRLIAGLSSATLVVEAALQSGSLITARLAAEQGLSEVCKIGICKQCFAIGCAYIDSVSLRRSSDLCSFGKKGAELSRRSIGRRQLHGLWLLLPADRAGPSPSRPHFNDLFPQLFFDLTLA